MRLMLITDDYLPGSTRVSAKMMHELAVELVAHGHEVVVLVPGHLRQTNRLEKSQMDGVEVWRFKSGAIKDVSKVVRLLNESLLSWRAWRAIAGEVRKKAFEGIVYYSPSIFWGRLVQRIKEHKQCKSYLVLRDLFPQWAIDEGMIGKDDLITRYLRHFETLSYQQADRIGLMSEKNIEVFRSLQPGYQNLEVLRNWVSLERDANSSGDAWRVKLGLQDKTIFLYGGNIGRAQDMENLMRLARALRGYEQAHFLFVGQGDEVARIKSLAVDWGLQNVTYHPSISQESFKALLAESDIGLFSLARTHTAHNFPGKILGYISQSIPILGSVNPGNDLLPLINQHQAGFVFENGQDIQLQRAAIKLLENAALRRQMGQNARTLLEDYFSVRAAANQIETFLGAD